MAEKDFTNSQGLKKPDKICQIYSPKHLYYLFFIILYVILLTLQINQRPFERYPEWDHFWVDTEAAGKLTSLKHALGHHEIPAIDPYTELGWNLAGDHHSIWGILNIFVLFFTPATVLILQHMMLLFLGAWGAFLYLYFITRNRYLSFLGGLTYISLPFTISLYYYGSSFADFNLVPLLLFLLHRLGKNISRNNLLVFIFFCAIAIGLADINFLLVLFTIIPVYSFLIGIWYYQFSPFQALKKSFLLSLFALLAGSFYLVPLFYNLHSIGSAVATFKEIGIVSLGSLGQKISFFSYFLERGGVESLHLPFEEMGLVLYIPALFYIFILLSLIFKPVIFRENQPFPTVFALILLGALMFFASFVFYHPLASKLIPGIREAATGVFRFHLHLLPFLSLLAAFICVSEINKIRNHKIKIGIYAVTIITSLLVDLDFTSNLPANLDRPYGSSNLVPVPIANPLALIPFVNLAVIFLLAASHLPGNLKNTSSRKVAIAGSILLAILVSLLGISNYNEWFATGQQGREPPLTRNPFRWESYLERKGCIDRAIPRYDSNYRTLYAGKGRVLPQDGRDWKLIAETELHVTEGEKVLFSYREFEHPFTGLLRGTFQKKEKTFKRAKLMPPLSREVPENLNLMRLMGVKWIISADEEIFHPDLAYRGKCFSREGPKGLQGGEQEEGYFYLYELLNPLGITFLANDYQKVEINKSLQTIYDGKDYPWMHGVVYLETDPVPDTVSEKAVNNPPGGESSGRVKIVRESFSSLELSVTSSKPEFLVLSYIYRPFWKVSVDGLQTRIYRAYGGFMSIYLSPGSHTVKFRYYPLDIYLGLILTFIAFLIPFAIIKKKSSGEIHEN